MGAVVDVEFSKGMVPKIYNALIVEETGLTLEVQQQIGDGVDLYDDVLTSSTSIKQELNGKEKITTLSSHISSNSLHGSSSLIGTPLQLHGSNSSSQTKRVQLYVGNLTWVRLFKPFHL